MGIPSVSSRLKCQYVPLNGAYSENCFTYMLCYRIDLSILLIVYIYWLSLYTFKSEHQIGVRCIKGTPVSLKISCLHMHTHPIRCFFFSFFLKWCCVAINNAGCKTFCLFLFLNACKGRDFNQYFNLLDCYSHALRGKIVC